jgi:hypothetical protein
MLKVGLYGNMPREGSSPSGLEQMPFLRGSSVPVNTAPPISGSGGYRIHPADQVGRATFNPDRSGIPASHVGGFENPAVAFYRQKLAFARRMSPMAVQGVRQNNIAYQ